MRITILTLFPEMFAGFLDNSIISSNVPHWLFLPVVSGLIQILLSNFANTRYSVFM